MAELVSSRHLKFLNVRDTSSQRPPVVCLILIVGWAKPNLTVEHKARVHAATAPIIGVIAARIIILTVIKSLTEIAYQDSWHRGLIAAVTVSPDQVRAEQVLQLVEREAALLLGPLLIDATTEWLA
jgi:uncharacterized protein YlxP (DUF503 family)